MEIAILVFFLAIFGGVLFLLGIIWFFVRRARNKVSARRQFSGGTNYASGAAEADELDSDFDSDPVYTDFSTFSSQESENRTAEATAGDSAIPADNTYSHASAEASAAPVESSYTENSYSSYESSSSYDSGSSYDSSSSSDSGSSDSGSSWSSD